MAITVEETKDDYLAAKQAIGRTDAKILFVRRCKTSKDKNDVKLLAITACRVYILTKKQQSKIDYSFHILDINSLDCSKPINLNITVNVGDRQNQHVYLFASQEDSEKAVSYLLALLKSNFININVDKQVFVKTESSQKEEVIRNQANLIVQSLAPETQPCAGFALAYMCLCDYYNQTALAEVIWDVNKIYASHDCKDFQVEDFDHLETKEITPLIAAVGYSTWFTSFVVSSYKLTNEVVDAIIRVIKRSPSIETITITDAHVNKEQAHRLSLALSANPNKTVKKVNLSKNALEDKGVTSLAGCISTLQQGIESLNLSEVALTAKGAGILASSLKNNKFMATSLTRLDLSGNVLKSEGAQSLCDFLAQPNAVEFLNISHTESALDLLFGAMFRGCQQNLQDVCLAGNPFSYRKSKEVQSLPAFQQFFTSSRALKFANLSNTKLPAAALKAIMVGLINNPVLTDVGLDLSHNEIKSAGSSEISSCIKDVRCLTKLNLADNGLDQDLEQLCEAISNSHSIRELDLARNVSKSKHNNVVSEALAEMVMSEILPLEKLSIADNKLRLDAAAIFDCVGTNETLLEINISGNAIGDVGARLIAKALQINTKLREIILDKNNITYKGLQDLALAMNRNYSLHSIPIPMADLTASLKHTGELFMKYYRQIEKALIRNQSTHDSTPDQAYKVHQGLLLSSIDNYTQFTDGLVVQLQDLVNKYKNSSSEQIQKEVKTARCLIKETDSFRQVLLQLFSDPESTKKILDEKFHKISQDFHDSIESVLQGNLDKMLNEAQKICPSALGDEKVIKSIKQELVDGGLLDKQVVNNSLIQFGKSNLTYKLCESNLDTGNSLAESFKKVLVEALQKSVDALSEADNKEEQAVVEKPKTESKQEESTEEDGVTEGKIEEEFELIEKEESKEIPKETENVKEKEDLKEKEETALDDTNNKTDEDKAKVEAKENKDSPPTSPLTPSVTITSSPIVSEMFDMPWELSAGQRISILASDLSDDDDADLAASKARSRLSTLTSRPDKHQRKRASVKRRPTFYRTEQDINIDTPSPRTQSGSVSTIKERPASTEVIDAPPERVHLPSVSALDAVSASASHLKVAKDRAKPQGRRAPSRVSKLAHMNTENADSYIDAQVEVSPKTSPKPSPKPSPRQRPVSAMPASNLTAESHPVQRAASDKIKPDAPRKPDKKESKKEKSKKPIGGIQLPSLPGFLRKGRGSSKAETADAKNGSGDVPDGKTNASTAATKPETKPNPPVTETKPAEPKSDVEPKVEATAEETNETPDVEPPAQPKPEPVKRPAMIPKIGIPMAGGSALLAEMKKRQNKGDGTKPPAPGPTAKPKPPSAAAKPERHGSIGAKPPPPKRPASLKKPNGEGKPVAAERPKPALQETAEESAMESVAEESKAENSAEELVRSSSLSADANKSTEDAKKSTEEADGDSVPMPEEPKVKEEEQKEETNENADDPGESAAAGIDFI
ncbi:F-actin-uncapping protein LRRC16A-like isoform X2 [Hydractinia symbiolongicarpus]|uniref:F-actin-uncapping protein LRRC16A-like isoform X2 n=1 Tax=Hydractinia symbiolongicarpus TaxID=13093 RepID=UPI002549D2F8|nr:F-actin-uncapping protein LRRC16A-like isoform X2 [Hydractinia symbiolongicarpus]